MRRILLIAAMLGSCVRTPPVEQAQQACSSCVEEESCEPKPAGKRVLIGNDEDFSVCIKADPANTDATCAPYEQELRDRGGNRAVQSCTDKAEHGVVCQPRTCKDTCRNTAVIVEGGGAFLRTEAVECAANEHACTLDFTTWQCGCTCQLEL